MTTHDGGGSSNPPSNDEAGWILPTLPRLQLPIPPPEVLPPLLALAHRLCIKFVVIDNIVKFPPYLLLLLFGKISLPLLAATSPAHDEDNDNNNEVLLSVPSFLLLFRILALVMTNANAVLSVLSSAWDRNGGGCGFGLMVDY